MSRGAEATRTGVRTRPDTPLVRPDLPPLESYAELLEEVWDSAMLSNFAEFGGRLEAQMAEYCGVPRCLAAANCDVALTLAVAALELPRGSEALMPSFAFPSAAAAATWNGLRVRFADVDPETFCLDPAAAADAAGPDTSLIIATHMFGVACDVEALEALAVRSGARLVFDAAQAVGTFAGERHVATFGDASVFSLGGTKVATSAEGALAVIGDERMAERFEALRNYGIEEDQVVRRPGHNAKLSELHAALGCLTLARVEESIAARSRLAGLYRIMLGGEVRFQAAPPGSRPSHSFLALDVGSRRDELAEHLAGQGVETKKYFPPLHRMPAFGDARSGPLQATERLAASLVCVPLHPGLGDEDVMRICDLVRAVVHA